MATSFADLSDSGSLGDVYSFDSGGGGVNFGGDVSGAAPMSTGMVDLSSLQTVNFGNGVTGSYDPTSQTYYDSGGNPLSASDLSQYGSFTISSPGATPPPSGGGPGPVAPVTGSGSGATLAGLSGMFSSIGNAIVNATRPPTLQTPQGTLVYNPQTGGYTTPAALTAGSALNPIILLLLAGIVLWVLLKEA